jgi:hypothetical protein
MKFDDVLLCRFWLQGKAISLVLNFIAFSMYKERLLELIFVLTQEGRRMKKIA